MKPDEIKYIVDRIKSLSSSVSREHYQWVMNTNYNPDFEEEYTGWTESWMRESIRDIYYLIQAYIEVKNLNQLLGTFKAQFENKINDDRAILKNETIHPEGEEELTILYEFRRFLNVFRDFDYFADELTEQHRLLGILKKSRHIVNKSGTTPSGEAEIYKAVKWALQLYYPSVRNRNKARFIQGFKCYEPDILIPEIKTAVEYKLVRTTANVDDYIDQVKTDANNYKGDYEYENFIAVLYLENSSITTSDAIELAWQAKNFPKNWKLVIAEGDKIVAN